MWLEWSGRESVGGKGREGWGRACGACRLGRDFVFFSELGWSPGGFRAERQTLTQVFTGARLRLQDLQSGDGEDRVGAGWERRQLL